MVGKSRIARVLAVLVAVCSLGLMLTGCSARNDACVGRIGDVHASGHKKGTLNVEIYGTCTTDASVTYRLWIERKSGSSWVKVAGSDSGTRTVALKAGKDFNLPAYSTAKCVNGTYRAQASATFYSTKKAIIGKHQGVTPAHAVTNC